MRRARADILSGQREASTPTLVYEYIELSSRRSHRAPILYDLLSHHARSPDAFLTIRFILCHHATYAGLRHVHTHQCGLAISTERLFR